MFKLSFNLALLIKASARKPCHSLSLGIVVDPFWG